MAKGAFYPELFLIQLYYRNPREVQDFLDMYRKDFLKIVDGEVIPTAGFKFNVPDYDIESVVALGSLVHEFYHYLQFTTRSLGVLYYECRYQQFLITLDFMHKIKELDKIPNFPLTHFQTDSNEKLHKLYKSWWDNWSPYQASIATGGMGDFQEEQSNFSKYIRSNLSTDFNPKFEFSNINWNGWKRDCTTSLLLETEAEIVTLEVLQYLFPDKWQEAWQKMSVNDPANCTLAEPFVTTGLSCLVPLIMDYSMQSTLFSKTKRNIISQSELFFSMIETIEDKYIGISHNDVMKFQNEILSSISTKLGIESLSEAISNKSKAFIQSGISKTSLGSMLSRTTTYRQKNSIFFTVPYPFIFIILCTIPASVWVNYNLGVLNKKQHRMDFQYGNSPIEEFDINYIRHLLWGAREIALREDSCICPDCLIKARYENCTGDCLFNTVMTENFHFNLEKNSWI
ncbi:MAG: hypothetical protein GXO79_08670 [Chlorobi bacterium]|nr:hypothetical protein [Chlorobiota bacterium]